MFIKYISIMFIVCATCNSFAQTVTIDYSFANLTDSCNVFGTPKIFQGYVHRTSFGFPYFSQTDGAIILQSKPINTTNKGATQYFTRPPRLTNIYHHLFDTAAVYLTGRQSPPTTPLAEAQQFGIDKYNKLASKNLT